MQVPKQEQAEQGTRADQRHWKTSISDQPPHIFLKSNFPNKLPFSGKSIQHPFESASNGQDTILGHSFPPPALKRPAPTLICLSATPFFHEQPNFLLAASQRQAAGNGWEQLRGDKSSEVTCHWVAFCQGRIFGSAQSWNYIAERNTCLVMRLSCIHLLCRKWTPDCNFCFPLNSLFCKAHILSCFLKHSSKQKLSSPHRRFSILSQPCLEHTEPGRGSGAATPRPGWFLLPEARLCSVQPQSWCCSSTAAPTVQNTSSNSKHCPEHCDSIQWWAVCAVGMAVELGAFQQLSLPPNPACPWGPGYLLVLSSTLTSALSNH